MNSGTNSASNPDSYTVETPTITLTNPTREGYEFRGWVEGNKIEEGSIGNKTFTAVWDAVSYPITYELNG